VHDRQVTSGGDDCHVGREVVSREALLNFVPVNMAQYATHPDASRVNVYDGKNVSDETREEIARTWEELKPLIEARIPKGKGVPKPPTKEELILSEHLIDLGQHVPRLSLEEIVIRVIDLLNSKTIRLARLLNKVLYTGYFPWSNCPMAMQRMVSAALVALQSDPPLDQRVTHEGFSSKALDVALDWGSGKRQRLYASHVTAHFLNGKPVPDDAVPPGEAVSIVMTHVAQRGGAIAARVQVFNNDGELISEPDAHITLFVPENGTAGDSRGFVTSDGDASTRVMAIEPPFTFKAVSVWKAMNR